MIVGRILFKKGGEQAISYNSELKF